MDLSSEPDHKPCTYKGHKATDRVQDRKAEPLMPQQNYSTCYAQCKSGDKAADKSPQALGASETEALESRIAFEEPLYWDPTPCILEDK